MSEDNEIWGGLEMVNAESGKSGRKKRQMSESNEIWGGLGMANTESGK